MRNIKFSYLLVYSLFVVACNRLPNTAELTDSKEDIDSLIRSDDPNQIVKGFYLIGEKRKIEYLPQIFNKIDDPRISHHVNFKGISIYQSKIVALRKISGLDPPKIITYKVETVNINFYYKWAKEKNILK